MDRDTYKAWHDHPLRHLLRRAAAGDPIRDDEYDDLRLPPSLKRATKQAAGQVTDGNQLDADRLSAEIFQALPDDHETRTQHEERRASLGDADALANIKAREEATARMADRILGGAHA